MIRMPLLTSSREEKAELWEEVVGDGDWCWPLLYNDYVEKDRKKIQKVGLLDYLFNYIKALK